MLRIPLSKGNEEIGPYAALGPGVRHWIYYGGDTVVLRRSSEGVWPSRH
jgi:hypothetical protein